MCHNNSAFLLKAFRVGLGTWQQIVRVPGRGEVRRFSLLWCGMYEGQEYADYVVYFGAVDAAALE